MIIDGRYCGLLGLASDKKYLYSNGNPKKVTVGETDRDSINRILGATDCEMYNWVQLEKGTVDGILVTSLTKTQVKNTGTGFFAWEPNK